MVGKVSGGFFKCEVCLIEKEILIVCLIDCLICLLFVEGFKYEVFVMCIVLFYDLVNDLDIVVMIVVFVVLIIFGVFFMGLIVVVCVGFVDGEYILNLEIDDMDELCIKLD